MALSWITGELSVEAMKERHPRELERLIEAGAIQEPEASRDGMEGSPQQES